MVHHNHCFVTRLDCYVQVKVTTKVKNKKSMNKPLLWPWTQQTNLSQNIMACNNVPPYQVLVANTTTVQKILWKSHTLSQWSWPWEYTDPKDTQTIFCMTPWLSMMHHHAMFGYKRYSISENIVLTNIISENIVLTNIHWNYGPALWPWALQSIFLSETLCETTFTSAVQKIQGRNLWF